MIYAPIALFCYRRKDVLEQTVEALKNNAESKESQLFIFSDGYKNDEDKAGVEEVRNYIKTIEGFKNVEIIEAQKNKGLANSIIDGVTRIVNEYGKIIVVEDDILTSPYFLKYMNDALDMYENDTNVGCISGYVYPIKTDKHTFFLKEAECWGWGTWKKGWDIFEPDGQKLLDTIIKRNVKYDFDFNDGYPFAQMLQDQIEGKNNSWAIRWYASCYLNNKLCLYPGKSLTLNIGFGVEGSTHCNDKTTVYDGEVMMEPMNLIRVQPIEKKEDRMLYVKYFYDNFNFVKSEKNNFLFKKEKNGNRRKITIFGFIKFSYKKRNKKKWST